MRIEIIKTTSNFNIDDIFSEFHKFILSINAPKDKNELLGKTIDLVKPLKVYCTLKCYCSNIGYEELDEIKSYLYSNRLCNKFDLDVISENDYYSIVGVKSIENRLIAKYGLYQPCVENYFKLKAEGKDSWVECLKESIKLKPIIKDNIYSGIRNLLDRK